jgi:hypothetical protein
MPSVQLQAPVIPDHKADESAEKEKPAKKRKRKAQTQTPDSAETLEAAEQPPKSKKEKQEGPNVTPRRRWTQDESLALARVRC